MRNSGGEGQTETPGQPLPQGTQVPPGQQPNQPATNPPENEEEGQGEPSKNGAEDAEPQFPHAELAKLDEMINRPRWVVPVLPKGELEVLLDAAIDLCQKSMWFF